jgi:predicted permease
VGERHVERNVDEEIAFHIEMRTKALVAAGVDPSEAHARAVEMFGDHSAVRAECLTIDYNKERAMRVTNLLEDLRRDAAYAVRSLRQHAGFTVIVVAILALGIGANTAMYTLLRALMQRPLPVPHAEQLVSIGDPTRTGTMSYGSPMSDIASYPLFADLREGVRTGNPVVSGLYATGRTGRLDVVVSPGATDSAAVNTRAEPEHPRGRLVSANFFDVLQVPAQRGRLFVADEDRVPGDAPVVVISDGYWQRRFARDTAILGRTLLVNGARFTIVGITPPRFFGDIVGQPMDFWMPLSMQPAIMPNRNWLKDRDASWLLMMGRLSPGVTFEGARPVLAAIEERVLTDHASAGELPGLQRQLRTTPVRVEPGARGFSYYRGQYADALVTLMATVALVLLLVCANVANLMLARSTARGREISVRLALGAGRMRLVRQLLTESALLGVLGAAVGLLVAMWGTAALMRYASPVSAAPPLDTAFDGPVLLFTVGLSIVTALVFGLVPAVRATRMELASALRTQGRGVMGASRGRGRYTLGKVLVVVQVALSLLLLVGTGMLVRSMQRLEGADVGFARDQLVIASVDAQRTGYAGPRLAALVRDVSERLRRIPGVTGVSYSENGIFSGTESATTLQVDGFSARAEEDTVVNYDDVGPAYFGTIGARLVQGRDFEERDSERGGRVAIVNGTMARFYFPAGDAVGHHVTVDSAIYEIVGVVTDVQGQNVRDQPVRRLYLPTMQVAGFPGTVKFEIRVPNDPASRLKAIREALLAADPGLSIPSVDAVSTLMRDSIGQVRLVANVVALFGALALVLAALGLYGVIAYTTVRRTNEFGVRLALGAVPGDVTRLVLREAMVLMAGGVVIGLPLSLLAMRAMRDQLFQVSLFDPPSLGFAIVVLGISAGVAAALPAVRASRAAPVEALRAE